MPRTDPSRIVELGMFLSTLPLHVSKWQTGVEGSNPTLCHSFHDINNVARSKKCVMHQRKVALHGCDVKRMQEGLYRARSILNQELVRRFGCGKWAGLAVNSSKWRSAVVKGADDP